MREREESGRGLEKERRALGMENGGSLEERETLRRIAISSFLFSLSYPKSKYGSWIRLAFKKTIFIYKLNLKIETFSKILFFIFL